MADSGDFSDGGSDDSGFEESVSESERKKEQLLENDKYDMALEVSASASMDADDLDNPKSSPRAADTGQSSFGSAKQAQGDKVAAATDRIGSGKSGDPEAALRQGTSLAGGGEIKKGEDVKNDQFDAAYDLSSADGDSSVDTREAAELAASKKRTIGAPAAAERHSSMSSAKVASATSAAVASAVAGLSSSVMRDVVGGRGGDSGGGSDSSDSGSDSSSNEDDRSSALKIEGAYDPADFAHLNVSAEIKDLFQYIGRYKAHEVDLDTSLRCFVPDFIPAVGDTDAFLKIPRPDHVADELGFKVLDESAATQSDASVLELQLRAISKKQLGDVAVRSIENAQKNPAEIDKWIQSINELHRTKPPPQVHYKKDMPDVEVLMEAWPPEIEEIIGNANALTSELDLPLEDYARMMCAFMDIPVYDNVIESLHVLFTTYMEFKSNAHFVQLGAGGGAGMRASTDFNYK